MSALSGANGVITGAKAAVKMASAALGGIAPPTQTFADISKFLWSAEAAARLEGNESAFFTDEDFSTLLSACSDPEKLEGLLVKEKDGRFSVGRFDESKNLAEEVRFNSDNIRTDAYSAIRGSSSLAKVGYKPTSDIISVYWDRENLEVLEVRRRRPSVTFFPKILEESRTLAILREIVDYHAEQLYLEGLQKTGVLKEKDVHPSGYLRRSSFHVDKPGKSIVELLDLEKEKVEKLRDTAKDILECAETFSAYMDSTNIEGLRRDALKLIRVKNALWVATRDENSRLANHAEFCLKNPDKLDYDILFPDNPPPTEYPYGEGDVMEESAG